MSELIAVNFSGKNPSKNNPERTSTAKYLMMLSMFYAVILSVCGLFTYRPVLLFHHFSFSASDFIYPLSYVVSDIICEVYGFAQARRLIWFGLMACFLFAFITSTTDHLPYPSDYAGKAQAYTVVLGSYIRLTFAGLFSMVLGEFLNTIVITRLRILLKGKWFWLRSIGSTAVGSGIDTLIEYTVAFSGLVSLGFFFKWVLFAYLFRILYAAVMGGPANLIVYFLRKSERSNAPQTSVFNPFTLSD